MAGNITATAEEDVMINKGVTAQQDVTLTSKSSKVKVDEAVRSVTGNVSATADKSLTIGANVIAQKDVTLTSTNAEVSVNNAVTSMAGNISATANKSLTIGENVTAQQDVTLINKNGALLVNHAVKSITGNVSVTADNSLTIGADVTAQKDVTLTSKSADVKVNETVTSVAGNISAAAKTGLLVNYAVHANQNVELTTITGGVIGGIGINAQVMSDSGNISMTATEGQIVIGDDVKAAGDVTIHVDKGETITDNDGTTAVNAIGIRGNVEGGGKVSLTAGEGSIGIGIGATDTDDKGKVTAGSDIEITSDKGEIAIYNTVTSSEGNIAIANGEEAIYVQSAVSAKGDVELTSQKGQIDIDSSVSSTAGNVSAAAGKSLTIDADVTAQQGVTLSSTNDAVSVNKAVTSVTGNITAKANKTLTIGADVIAQKDVTLQSTKADVEVKDAVNSKAGNIVVTADTTLTIGADVTADKGGVKATTRFGDVLISGDITVGNMKNVLLETKQGDIYVGTFINEASGMLSANGSIGSKTGTAGKVTVKTGSGVVDILKTVAASNIEVENGNGDIVIGINEHSEETVTATNNISLITKRGQIAIYGKTSTVNEDITMKAASNSYDEDNPGSNFIIGQYGELVSGRDITLEGLNGDIHITDDIKAKRNINATIQEHGSLFFDNELKVDGSVTVKVNEGSITMGVNVTAGQDVSMKSDSGDILISGDVTVGKNKDVLLETKQGDIYVGTFIDDENGIVSANGSIGAKTGTAGKVTVKTGSGVVDILKTVTATNIEVENGNGDIVIGINEPSEEAVTATENISLITKLGQIAIYGKTTAINKDITMKAAANSYDEDNPGSNFIIGQYGELVSGRDITLEGQNGDIHVTDDIKAKRNINTTILEQGSLYFDTDIDVTGDVNLQTTRGDINIGHNVTSDKSIKMETGTGDINIGNKVTAADSVLFNTVHGDISIDNTVTAQEGNIQAHAGQGDITIGDNGPTEDTVTANKNISLVTDDGKIYIYGKTSTKEEDIYLSVANKHFAEGEDGRLIIFDHNGMIDSARSVELQGTNGDIHVTDEIKAALNLDVKTTSQGNIYFDRAVDSAGNVSAETDTGNITASRVNAAGNVSLAAKRGDINFASAQAKNDVTIQIGTGNLQADSIISDQSIRTETGRGDTNIALVDAANVSIFMGDNSTGSSLGTVRANATGGVSDVALGGNYISVGTVKAKNGGSALVVFTQGATRGQASDDITINSVSAPGGTIMPQVWSNTGSIYVAEGNFRASKVYALDNMRFANNKVRVGLYGNMNNFDRTIISYFNDTSENRPQDHLSDWFSGSYSDRRWLYVDLSEEGNVRSRYGKLINSNGYRYLDTDNISVADNMQNMLDRWFPMGTGLVYFDRYGLIYYEGLAEDNKEDKFVVEN